MREFWTFVRCGKDGKPEGEYDGRYEIAVERSLREASYNTKRIEFVYDFQMPEPLRYKGWWGMLQLYNPDAEIGNPDGNIYAAGLDTVFLQDIDGLMDALDAVPHDIAGIRCFSRGTFNDMVLRIKRGSPGAVAVWEAAKARNFEFEKGRMEHRFVERHGDVGWIEDKWAASYKQVAGMFPTTARDSNLETASVLVFHGHPRPHEVCANPNMPLRDLVVDKWGKHIGYAL